MYLFGRVLLVLMLIFSTDLLAQEQISFGSSGLQGESISNPTSLDFGPDGKLYVSQQDGTILRFTVVMV